MEEYKRSPQSKNSSLDIKNLIKSLFPPGELNPGLPIQSQVCLPSNQDFTKMLEKTKNFGLGVLKLKF